MDKLSLKIFCFLSLVVLIYSAEDGTGSPENQRAYDLEGLVKRISSNLRSSLRYNEFGPLDGLRFNGIDENFQFQPVGGFLQNSSKCLGDILYTLQNLKSQWALRLFDSFGKPGSGILQGNFRWVGDYDECIGVRASNPNSSAIGNFRGKYCSLTLSTNFLNTSFPLPFSTAICIPDSCSAEELKEDAWQLLFIAGAVPVLNKLKPVLNTNLLTCKPNERRLNSPAKGVIALLSVFCTLALLGSSITVVKYFKKVVKEFKAPALYVYAPDNILAVGEATNKLDNVESNDNKALLPDDESDSDSNVCLKKLEAFLRCFCIFTNGAKILNTDASEGELVCIHGIRFLSMSWVILGHAYLTGFANLVNMLEVPELMKNFSFQIILQGFYSVDSFFVLSGFLLTYLTMKEFSKTRGSIPWPYFYIHRFIRLTPIYMVVLGFSATVYLYLGSGPSWPDNDLDALCRDNWWRNLIYINNFSDQTSQCMAWSWYLANDMQFFVISPLFLITLWRWPKVGMSLVAAFLFASWAANFYITYHYDLVAGFSGIMSDPSLANLASLAKIADFFNKIYIKPYTRIGPYLVGMLTGYLLFRNKASNRPKHSLVFLCVGWFTATAITLTCVYGLFHSHPTKLANSFYNALNRTGFALGLSWVIYVCLVGQGGVVNNILSFKMFIPLSRLTYAAYLIHPMILGGYFSSLKTPLKFTHPTIVTLFLGFMVVSYAFSLPVALVFESPIVSLEKLVRKKFTRQKPEAVN